MNAGRRIPRLDGRHGMGPGAYGEMPAEEVRDFKTTFKRLLIYLHPYRFQLFLVLITSLFSTAFNILGPKITGLAITKLFADVMLMANSTAYTGVDFIYITKILIILAALYLLSALCNYFQQTILVDVSQNTVLNLRQDLYDKLTRLPLAFFDSHTHGEILSRITNDTDNISNTLQQSIIQFITGLVTIIGIVIMMVTISPILTLVTLFMLPLYVLITKITASYSQKYFRAQQKNLGELNGHIEEMFTGHKIVKAFGGENKAIEKFEDINRALYEASWKAQFISGCIMPMMILISNLGYIIIAVLGALLVIQRTIQVGDIHAFIQYSRQIQHPINQMGNILNIIQSTIASAERVFDILDEPEEPPDIDSEQIAIPAQGNISFRNVQFRYREDTPLIENMNIDIKQGQTVAIVGPTGAGKTTLVNLLLRFYDINSGSISIDGIDIRKLKRGDLRTMFAMVLQDTWLFNASIMDNIAYGREGATAEEVQQAAKAAHADNFIRSLPEGYATILNEEASNLSQGQKQLLTIARAMLANPVILILDEATSNVDTRTEILIKKAMTKLMKNRTTFIIAHRLSTIRDADLILVMDKGKVVEKGTHAELLAQDGFYAEIYNNQFIDYDSKKLQTM
jgi:ATP-binding cassette subfamily B multidrug efflux pump